MIFQDCPLLNYGSGRGF